MFRKAACDSENCFKSSQGVLGNKCAGWYNLKTFNFKETIVSGNFLPWSSAICVFLQCSIYYRTVAASSSVAMVGATPYTFFLKVPWVNKQLASSDFTLRKKLKAAGVKYSNNGAGRTSWHLFPLPVIENIGGDGSLADGQAEKKFCTDILGLLSPKTTLNLF
jgi:hypothetical protein